MNKGEVYLIPCFLCEENLSTLPEYIKTYIPQCSVFFVENLKSARRFIKKLLPDFVINNYEWVSIHQTESTTLEQFKKYILEGKTIGIISEAGCPGIADPGQLLVQKAQTLQVKIHPLVGPSSILLALMASGMNGQNFHFHGYLPIENLERKKSLRNLEKQSQQQHTTQIFIETPYRNNAVLKEMTETLQPQTLLCIAIQLTDPKNETIRTLPIHLWKKNLPDLHKQLCIFLVQANI